MPHRRQPARRRTPKTSRLSRVWAFIEHNIVNKGQQNAWYRKLIEGAKIWQDGGVKTIIVVTSYHGWNAGLYDWLADDLPGLRVVRGMKMGVDLHYGWVDQVEAMRTKSKHTVYLDAESAQKPWTQTGFDFAGFVINWEEVARGMEALKRLGHNYIFGPAVTPARFAYQVRQQVTATYARHYLKCQFDDRIISRPLDKWGPQGFRNVGRAKRMMQSFRRSEFYMMHIGEKHWSYDRWQEAVDTVPRYATPIINTGRNAYIEGAKVMTGTKR